MLVFRPAFGLDTHKIGTIQRRLALPLHKDDTLVQIGWPSGHIIFLDLLASLSLAWLSFCNGFVDSVQPSCFSAALELVRQEEA
jgi:hypothetical protein